MATSGRALTVQQLLDSFGDDRPVGAQAIRDLIATLASPTSVSAVNHLPRWRSALGKMASGQADARVLCIGDSTTFGVGSNNANGSGGGSMVALSYPTQLATVLSGMGFSANAHAIVGFGSSVFESKLTNDARVSAGNSWSLAATNNLQSCGGCMALATTATNSLNFTPTTNVDTFKVWGVAYGGAGPNGVVSAQINSNAAITYNFNSTPTRQASFTTTATLGANTLKLSWSSGGKVYISAIEAWNSSAPQICIANAGWPGAGLKDMASVNSGSSGFDPLVMAQTYAPDLYIVSVGINDWRSGGSGITPAQYKATLTSYCSALNSVADVMLVSPAPSLESASSYGYQQQFVSAMREVANDGGYQFVDCFTRFGPYGANASLYGPLPTPGNLHPNMVGYSDFARAVANAMLY